VREVTTQSTLSELRRSAPPRSTIVAEIVDTRRVHREAAHPKEAGGVIEHPPFCRLPVLVAAATVP